MNPAAPPFVDLYPSLLKRFQSTAIDGVIQLLLLLLFAQVCDSVGDLPIWLRVVFLGSVLLYEPLGVTLGCTPGQYVVGIRVRQDDNYHRPVHFGQAVCRYACKLLLGWLSFLTIHANPRKRALHDLVTGSVMIRPGVLAAPAGQPA